MLTGRVMRLQRVAGLRASPGPHLVPALPFSAACRTRDVKAHQQPARSAGVLPSDANQSPFAELDILEITEGLGRTRVRQHVNPLSRQHQVVAGPLPWHEVFSEPTAPLVVDLGCGPGRFLLLLHHRRRGPQQPTTNYLGLEIRKPVRGTTLGYSMLKIRKLLVERANEWVPRLGFQGAVHYCTCNATISLGTMLSSYPGRVQLVCIQFPDPHFKRRHYKRRIFQPQMVRDVAQLLAPGGQLFLQSDVLEVAVAMRNMVEKYVGDCFELSPLHHEPGAVFWQEPEPAQLQQPTQHQEDAEATSTSEDSEEDAAVGPGAGLPEAGDDGSEDDDYLTLQSVWAQAGWLSANPLGVPTEREHYVQQQGLPVYRILLARKQT